MLLCSKSKIALLATLLAVCCAWPLAARARAEAVGVPGIEGSPGSGVTIRVTTTFKELTPAGFATLQIYIHNVSGQSHTWTFNFISSAAGQESFASSREFTVPNNKEVTFEALVPLAANDNPTYTYMVGSLQITASGYGVAGGTAGLSSASSSGRNLTDYVLISQELNVRSWGPLEKACSDRGSELIGSEFDPYYVPTDWRGYIGVGTMLITDSEFQLFDPVQRNAIHEWVLQGGNLMICSTTQRQPGDFGYHDGRPGYGHVRLLQWDGHELDAGKVMPFVLSRDHSVAADLSGGYASRWNLANAIGHLQFNGGFIMAFVICFGLVIGPLNLFRFARSGHRHRLFWTTPLISIAGSVALALVIVLQDGFGGTGKRMVLVQLIPGENEAVVAQEQISRTGLLLSTSFKAEDKIFISPIYNLDSAPGAAWTGAGSQARTYTVENNSYGGGWFASRSVQGQLLEVIRPSRSRIEIIPAADGSAPSLLSSVENELDEVFYIDEGGRYWHTDRTGVGEKKTLHPSTEADFDKWMASNTGDAGARIGHLLDEAAKRRNYFYAVADDPEADAVATMPSIHWDNAKTIYLGPCAGENGAPKP